MWFNKKIFEFSQWFRSWKITRLFKFIFFMNSGHKNKLGKVEELLILALSKNIKLSYRCLFKKDD